MKRNEKGMLIELDMENAFDRVNHSFLIKVLLTFGFSCHFVQLINACINNPWIAPLVNGHPSNFFQARRGIRQGCPLFPFLYILMADSLSRKLTAERILGTLPGLKASFDAVPQNHSLFVDDSLLLGGASPRITKGFDSYLKATAGSQVLSSMKERAKFIVGTQVNKRPTTLWQSWDLEVMPTGIELNISTFQ